MESLTKLAFIEFSCILVYNILYKTLYGGSIYNIIYIL
jgi:hypothetical protein